MSQRDDVLVWVDLEMTGLEPETCGIVEMAMILTDRQLAPLAPPWEVVVWQPEPVLAAMNPFVREMHEKSGLLARVRAAKLSVADAERQALELLTAHATYRSARLCGNSVWQDRRFLARYMPAFEGYLHYRQIDVSSVKELCDWWYGKVYPKPTDREHTARFDIEQSIAELRYLKANVLD